MSDSSITDLFVRTVGIIAVITVIVLFITWAGEWWAFTPFCEESNNQNICQNNGTCVSISPSGFSLSRSDYYCSGCDNGWKGKKCDEVDLIVVSERPCEKDKPCKNDSKCTNVDTTGDGVMDDYECECTNIDNTTPWIGKDCNTVPDELEKYFDSPKGDEDGVKQYGYKFCPILNTCVKDYDINCPDACTPPTDFKAWCPDIGGDIDKCINIVTGKSDDGDKCILPDNIDDYDCSDVKCHKFSGSGTEDNKHNKKKKKKCKKHDECCKWKNKKKICKKRDRDDRRDRDGRRDRDRNYWRESFVVGGLSEY